MINFTILAQSTSFEYLFIGPYFILMFAVKIIIYKFTYIEKIKNEIEMGEELIEKWDKLSQSLNKNNYIITYSNI